MHTSLQMARLTINVFDRMQECGRERLQNALRQPYILVEKAWILEGFGMC